jgi:hypothetical protein
MGATSKIALGVAGGYVLGRSKKLKLAIALGGMLAGKRLAGGRNGLLPGADLLEKSPELARLQKDSGDLVEAVKTAALTSATQRLHTLGETLRGNPLDSAKDENAGQATDDTDDTDDSGETGNTGEGSQGSTDSDGTDQGDSARPAKKKDASKSSDNARMPEQRSATKGTKKTAKKTAKKTTGANRRSSGG